MSFTGIPHESVGTNAPAPGLPSGARRPRDADRAFDHGSHTFAFGDPRLYCIATEQEKTSDKA